MVMEMPRVKRCMHILRNARAIQPASQVLFSLMRIE